MTVAPRLNLRGELAPHLNVSTQYRSIIFVATKQGQLETKHLL